MIVEVFDKSVKVEDKGGVVGGGGCGVGKGRKRNLGGGLREGDGRDNLLSINIVWLFVKFIDVFASLLNCTRVSN